ncbi:putative EF-hand domain-containing protein [Helianthus anomalus]
MNNLPNFQFFNYRAFCGLIPNHKTTITMCPTVVSSVLSARTISYLRLAFDIMDSDHDSMINHKDLKTSYTDYKDDCESVLKNDVAGNIGMLEVVCKVMDRNGDGKVDDDENKAMIRLGGDGDYGRLRLTGF